MSGSGAADLAFLGISHSPLLGLNEIDLELDAALRSAIAQAGEAVQRFEPEQIVLIAPDHYNGFFNELMPTFCIGTDASAVGDYKTPAGPLNVDADAALSLVEWLANDGFDPAVSRRMKVDHAFSQPLQLLWGGLDTPPIIPVFVNAAAPPSVMSLARARQLGLSVGEFLRQQQKRTLILASGGLSHEPPVPMFDTADAATRERITVRPALTQDELDAKLVRVTGAGQAFARGETDAHPLNPVWDRAWMDALASASASGEIDRLTDMSEESIARDAGRSAHESKTWLIGRCALGEGKPLNCPVRFYADIPEFIVGFGILFLQG